MSTTQTTTIETLNEISVHELGIILNNTTATTVRNAVLALHRIKVMEDAIAVLKKAANDKLELHGEEIITTDLDGQRYAVKRVEMNERKYKQTSEYKAAEAALNDAKDHLADVKTVTPYTTIPKGAGFYFKTANLDNLTKYER